MNTEQVYKLNRPYFKHTTGKMLNAGTLVTVLAMRTEDKMALVRLHPRKSTTWANSFACPADQLEAV